VSKLRHLPTDRQLPSRSERWLDHVSLIGSTVLIVSMRASDPHSRSVKFGFEVRPANRSLAFKLSYDALPADLTKFSSQTRLVCRRLFHYSQLWENGPSTAATPTTPSTRCALDATSRSGFTEPRYFAIMVARDRCNKKSGRAYAAPGFRPAGVDASEAEPFRNTQKGNSERISVERASDLST
jgi:hypothetical protein